MIAIEIQIDMQSQTHTQALRMARLHRHRTSQLHGWRLGTQRRMLQQRRWRPVTITVTVAVAAMEAAAPWLRERLGGGRGGGCGGAAVGGVHRQQRRWIRVGVGEHRHREEAAHAAT